MKQTAVEWLVRQLDKQGFLYDLDIEAAKEMEKQQIINAYESGIEEGRMRELSEEYNLERYENAERYYNNNFKTNKI